MPENTDPYLYPGTDVLRNLPGIVDETALGEFEAASATARIAKLRRNPVKGKFDAAHLRAIHKYVFQDVYAWAGEFRSVNISKGGNLFAAAAFIEPAIAHAFRNLPTENYLTGADTETFIARSAYYLSELNAVHPFREGNGRTQREFIRTLGLHAGRELDWSRVTREEMIEASRQSFQSGARPMITVIRSCLV
ncbi:MAG: Fic family protein [Bryobacteraceae bacterium]